MTKFIVLGGAGDMGSNAARYLYQLLGKKGENITVGDYRADVAKDKMNEIDPRISIVKVDANNDKDLVNLLKNYDILINCIGPNFKYAVKIAKAAAEAKINGVDICDDSDPTLEMIKLNEEDPRFKDITFIYGCGWTPGLTNIISKRASELLDSLHTLSIAWTGDPSSEGVAVVEHMLKIMTGHVKSFQNGELIDVPAGSGIVRVKFPKPIGKAKVFDVGHPEPLTIPLFIDGLKEVTLKGGLIPYWATTFLMEKYVKTGRTTTPEKLHKSAVELQQLAKTDFEAAIEGVPSTYKVEARGIKDGKPTTISFTGAGGMDELTSLPAALAAVMISEGKITKKGLLPPEACIPAGEFLERYQNYGPKISIEQF